MGSLARHVSNLALGKTPVYGIVSNHSPKTIAMLQQLLSITQTAERLRVRPDYVRELVKKKRLTFIHGEQFDATQVEKLAKLMDKLRNNGIATLVQIVDEKGELE